MKFKFGHLLISGLVAGMVVFAGCNNPSNENAKSESESASEKSASSHDPECVDLGLSVKWASCNIGATSPEDNGDYFAWGETEPKSEYTVDNYSYSDRPTMLPSNADAATVNWGDGWRMPTKEEFEELTEKCDLKCSDSGCKVTGPNGNSIFLPAAGYRVNKDIFGVGYCGDYRSASRLSGNLDRAWGFGFSSNGHGMNGDSHDYGISVRAVCQ